MPEGRTHRIAGGEIVGAVSLSGLGGAAEPSARPPVGVITAAAAETGDPEVEASATSRVLFFSDAVVAIEITHLYSVAVRR